MFSKRTLIIGAAFAVTVGIAGCASQSVSSTAATTIPESAVFQKVVTISEVSRAVTAAQKITALPSDLTPSLINSTDKAWAGAPYGPCHQLVGQPADVPVGEFGGCLFGDYQSDKLMVVYGDSHAGMWSSTLEAIAIRDHWSLRTFALPYCPPEDLTFVEFGKVNAACAAFHRAALTAIRVLHPKLLVVTGQTIDEQSAPGVFYTSNQWKEGLVRTIEALKQMGTRVVVIGNIPQWTSDDADCLAAHETDVQACMVPRDQGIPVNVAGERAAAQATGVAYIDPTPWVCSQMCVPVVGNMRVFLDEYHFTRTYAVYLSGALQQALGLGN
jgi:hypothetical protein